MTRVKNKRKKYKKIFNLVKNQRGANLFKIAKQRFLKKLTYQFISRKLCKRYLRSRWISRINNQLKMWGTKYSLFISSLRRQRIILNRKILYFILLNDLL